MNCLEAQSMIMAFIDGKLPDDEHRDFIRHVRSCENCYEELNIYYTLIVGMKKLDESDNIPTDFKDSLDRKLDGDMERLTRVKRIANSTIMLVIAAVIAGLVWLYDGALNKIYVYEQNSKKNEQPENYYASFFDDRLLGDGDYMTGMLDSYYTADETDADTAVAFMSDVRKYNETHTGITQ